MKIRFIIISLIVSLLGVWGYAAYKFEKECKEQIIAVIDNFEKYVSYDSIKINKYVFSVTLNKVMFKPLDFYYDEIIIRYIPLFNIIKIDSYGNNVKIITAENEESIMYSPDHHTTVWIREFLSNESPNHFKMSANFGKSSFYSSNIAEKLSESSGGNIVINHTRTSNNLNLLDLDVKTSATFVSDNYLKEINRKIFNLLKNEKLPNFNPELIKSDFYGFLTQLQLLNLPEKYNYKLKFKYSDELAVLGKLFFENFSSNEEQDDLVHQAIFMQIAAEIYNGKPFLFALDLDKKGKVQSSFYKVNIEKDKEIDFTFNFKAIQEPSETYENTAIDVVSSLYFNILNEQIKPHRKFKSDEFITKDDLAKIIGFTQKINNFEFNLKGEFNPEENKLNGKTNLIIDDFDFAFDVDMPNLKNPLNLKSQIVLSDPNIFINNLINYIDDAVVPALDKIEDSREFASDLKKQISIVNKYGFGVIQAISKNSELEENEPLIVDIEGKNYSFTINEKTIDQILSDERIIEFINAMNQESLESISEYGK